jgi:hypothetical protein
MIAEPTQIAAIPTRYAGTLFRSRLEAKWAAFFDLLRWPWEYEPIDLNGYIPDFIISFKTPLLVEIKPETAIEHRLKIESSGWQSPAMVVGSSVRYDDGRWLPEIGDMGEWAFLEDRYGWLWGTAGMFVCKSCRKWSVLDQEMSFHCRACGGYEGSSHVDSSTPERAVAMWREAGNTVQWRSPAETMPR